MATPEDVKLAKDVLQTVLKAKKNLRLYPSNNPIYARTVEETYRKFEEFFEYQEEIPFRLSRNEIFLDGESVYLGSGKDENLALFFFRDGLREITFKRDLEEDELREFLEILSFDFDSEDVEDDVVTLLWAKDFQNIKYVVDDAVLVEDEDYERQAVSRAMEAGGRGDGDEFLKEAYEEASRSEEAKASVAMPISEEELKALIRDIEKDSEDKKEKLTGLLFDILGQAEDIEEYKDVVHVTTNAVEYCVKQGDLRNAVSILKRARQLADSTDDREKKRQVAHIFTFAGSPKLVKVLGDLMDKGTEINEEDFGEYVRYLDRTAIAPFVSLLGDLETIGARKSVINALTFLGGKDLEAVARGLGDDRWYVVRNIIYILRQIGDSRAFEYLVRAGQHEDVRVRKEVLKTLGELGGQGAAQTIKGFLDDPDPSVRTTAVRALSAVGSEYAKKTVLERITDKKFLNLDFNEKKECFEALSKWKDDAKVTEFLGKLLKSSSLFKRARFNELRACAAHCAGLTGNRDFLAELEKLRKSKNRLLNEYAYNAIKRIEYGR
jgi:HEAT repeat protein